MEHDLAVVGVIEPAASVPHAAGGPSVRTTLVTGVCNPRRLAAVEESGLLGGLEDVHLDAVVGTVAAACAVPIAVVNVVRPGEQVYPAEIGLGTDGTAVADHLSPCAEIVDTGEPLAIPDLRAHPAYADNPFVRAGAVRAFAGAPLVDDGVVLGTVAMFDRQPRAFSAVELTVLHHQARLAAAVVRLHRSARADPLTGLPNRTLVFERLGRALQRLDRAPGAVGVLFLDVNDFKQVNDRYGHDAGDRYLRELARRLTAAARRQDTLGRIGGDEFVAVCELASEADLGAIRARFLEAMREPVLLGGAPVEIRISVGTASTTSATTSPSVLLRIADAHMYADKRR